jgi:dimethylhistidine N-methyltransferase
VTLVTCAPAEREIRELFALEVGEYLRRTPRQLPSKYLYDDLGSSLFNSICLLPWYHVTRAESTLLARHAREIVAALDRPLSIAELGCGSGDKLATLVEHAAEDVARVSLIDISASALEMAGRRIEPLRVLDVVPHRSRYEDGLEWLDRHRGDGSMLVLFLGSNIGNFDPPAAHQMLTQIRRSLRPGDALLLGADLAKPERDLLLAYDDPLQVTAAFNRNLLRRINDDLGGTFDLDGFSHCAVWNEASRRVEMHLVSRRRQTVVVRTAGLEITFKPDEWIWTESSYKYEPGGIVSDAARAGLVLSQQWVDESAGFALTRFTVQTASPSRSCGEST